MTKVVVKILSTKFEKTFFVVRSLYASHPFPAILVQSSAPNFADIQPTLGISHYSYRLTRSSHQVGIATAIQSASEELSEMRLGNIGAENFLTLVLRQAQP